MLAGALEEAHQHKAEIDDFWAPPGVRVELGEATAEALAREMRDETGLEVRVGRLLWVAESFFTFEGRAQHGICFCFLVHLPEGCSVLDKDKPFAGQEEGLKLEFRWFHRKDVADLDVRPAFLRAAMQELPDTIVHILDVERR
jgi:ADP-ribose pyrophosphatase YjhB (NUDIX family)